MQRLLVSTALLVACSAAPERPVPVAGLPFPEGPIAAGVTCNPLSGWDCFSPYPTSVFARRDDALPGGLRLEHTPEMLPKNLNSPGQEPIDFFEDFPTDGAGLLPQISVRIPGGIDDWNLVFHNDDLTRATTESSPTLLIDAQTGEPVLHFAELDPRPEDVDDRALIIRPLVRLKPGHRYVVAIHDLTTRNDRIVPPAAGWRKLLDVDDEAMRTDDADDDDVTETLALYTRTHILPVLEKVDGLELENVQLAWDFTTQTEAGAMGDLLSMRGQLLAQLDATPPEVEITEVDDTPEEAAEHIGREVKGFMTVPLFLETTNPGAKIHRGEDGRPAQNGTMRVRFTVRVPHSVLDGTRRPGRMVQYGHGFFGGHLEIESVSASRFANETGSLLIATDWMGMTSVDAAELVGQLLSEPSHALRFVQRLHQGMMNFLALGYVARDVLPTLDALKKDGELLYDPSALYFYGISQGHILGTTFVSLSPQIERAALSVGGVSFGFMMSRAGPFLGFLGAIETALGAGKGNEEWDRKAKARAFQLSQLMSVVMERVDPITYTAHLIRDTFPGSPAERRVLMQIGMSDTQVPNLASHLQARSTGIPLLQPAPREIFGLDTVTSPHDGSAMVEFDFHEPVPDTWAKPNEGSNPVHEGVRTLDAAISQIDEFLSKDGKIQNFCHGACDPE